jgi:hypothetical protein
VTIIIFRDDPEARKVVDTPQIRLSAHAADRDRVCLTGIFFAMALKTQEYDKPPIIPVIPTVIWAAISLENPSIFNNRMPGIPTIPANDHPEIIRNSGDFFMLSLFMFRLKGF